MQNLQPETVGLLLASLAVILASAELFTNGVEWLGRRLNLAEGAVGSVLAAVGTALPETFIPFVAILITGGASGDEIGIGAILGAPFMLGTLAMFITGLAAVGFARRRRHGVRIVVSRSVLLRDLLFFLSMYAVAVASSFAPWRGLHIAVCFVLLAGYVAYLRLTLAGPQTAEGEIQALRLQRVLNFCARRRRPTPPPPAPRHSGDSGADTLHPHGHAAPHVHPRLRVIVSQVVIALAGILGGAYFFVGATKVAADALEVAPMLVALVIAPIATELPEKFNSVIWMRQSKDTYALGNITGAMVFQSTFPVSLAMAFTDWRLLAPAGDPQYALYSVVLALTAGLWLALWALLARRESAHGRPARLHLHPAVLLACGLLYAVFIALLVRGA